MTIESTEPSPGSVEVTEGVVVDPVTPVEASSPSDDANAANSSVADDTDAKAPRDLLSVIKSAVEKPVEPEVSSTPAQEEVAAEPKVEPVEGAVEGDDEADVPFHKHPRWQALVAERNELRDPAERYGAISTFMAENNLEPAEVAEGFEVMALLKSNTVDSLTQAREWFAQRLTALDGAIGNVIPEDLQTKVDDGLIDEETAKEVARNRAAAALRETGDQAAADRSAAVRQADEQAASAAEVVGAVTVWEQQKRATDPDYPRKAELVETTCRAIVQRTGKAPGNAAEATALVEQAFAEVEQRLKSLLPKPRVIVPSPIGSSATSAPAAKTLREAINAAVGR